MMKRKEKKKKSTNEQIKEEEKMYLDNRHKIGKATVPQIDKRSSSSC